MEDRIDLDLKRTQMALDLTVAGFSLAVREIRELTCLLESKQVFLPVVTLKSFRDSFGGILYSRFSHEGHASRGPSPPR